ncbi:MAG: ATP-binding protein [Ruminococcaceae bacterium]|nr:ATP-binding protein [Oscillospiraceae bacterium]
MTEQQIYELSCRLGSLTVFRNVLNTPTMRAFTGFLDTEKSNKERIELFGEFIFSLAEDNYSFSDFLCRAVYTDENKYICAAAQKADIPAVISDNAKLELELFTSLTRIESADLWSTLEFSRRLPRFANKPVDFVTTYGERLKNVHKLGYGIFASAVMFRVEGEEIVPVKSADTVDEHGFVGYEEERAQVFENTEALINGRNAANVLLFGDAGTGKSSTVKACVNRYADSGVRLIEVRKDQLFSLSHVMGRIADNPLKFIIFIDDLSFNKNDDCFSMLKAALEGSASAKAKNAVIYATSNRRHIVKESFSDRGAENDVHHSDTVQELLSLSDRFGLTVYFERPNKALYLDIVHKLAARYGIKEETERLDRLAEAFALKKGSRSPRAAEQFIYSLL